MAHSLSAAARQPDGEFEHAPSGTHFSIRSTPAGMLQKFHRNGESGEQRVAYVIGSGAHASGYLVQIGDHLFQSPLSYYTNRGLWDVAPGYEASTDPDFSRPVTLECVLCHSGTPEPIPDTLNRYQSPPFQQEGISCDRCHGPGEAHAKDPVPGSIVNPAKLPTAARDSICEQCHLIGEVRIPNPGKIIADFRPGQALEDAYTVYIARQRDGKALKVISHSEQLALSICARSSGGRLWCGSCHDPHMTPINPAAYFRERCLNCHVTSLEKSHAAPGRDCVACHMPRLAARDGGHTAFTNHRIARRPYTPNEPDQSVDLYAWRQPEFQFRQRNLALALVIAGLQNASPAWAGRGYRMLNQVEKKFPDDPDVLTMLGNILVRGKQPEEALRRFERVLSLRPAYAPNEVNAALALLESGDRVHALQHLERALQLDPLLQQAIGLLSKIYRDQGETTKANGILEHYRRQMNSVQAR